MTDKHSIPAIADSVFKRILTIIHSAQASVVRTVNSAMVTAYWHIGQEIVEEQQNGKERAEYGENLLEQLAAKLTTQVGKGFSATNLRNFRKFYLTYPHRAVIQHAMSAELFIQKQYALRAELKTLAEHT